MDTKLTPKLNIDLEGRVAERTAQLAAANEQLRMEIAERRRAEAQFRYQAQLLAAVKDAVIATDERLVIAFWNPAAEAIYGWQAGEVIGRPIVEVLQTEYDRTTREAVLQTALETGEYRGEVRQLRKDGSPVPIESTVRALRDANGRPMGLVGVNRDITERKRAEEVMRRQALIFESIYDAVIVTDLEGRIIDWNPGAERQYGYSKEEVLGQTPALLNVLQNGQGLTPIILEGVERAGRWSGEIGFIRKDGTVGISETVVVPMSNERGQRIGMVGVNHDITERKRAEEAMCESQAMFQGLFESAPDAIVVVNHIGQIVKLNQQTESLFGYRVDELHGQAVEILLPERFREQHPQYRAGYLMAPRPRPMGTGLELYGRRKDGGEFPIDINLGSLETSQGIVVLAMVRDITDRKRAEETIRLQSARARLLADISQTFAEIGLDYQDVLRTVARRTAELIGEACVITLFSDDGQRSFPVAFHHPDPKALALMHDALLHTWQGGTDTERFHTLLSGEAIYIPVVIPEEYRASSEPEFWPYLDTIGISSVLIVPLRVQDHVIGTLGITRDRLGVPYARDDQVLLQDLADRAALAIQNARLFQSVSEQREQLRALSTQLVEVQETERQRLAWEIHDDVSQSLTALMMQLGAAQGLLPKSSDRARAVLKEAETLTGKTLEGVRRIIADLRPPVLDDLGLAPALRRLGDELRERAEVDVTFEASGPPERLPPQIENALFRIAQEALTNIRKHAQAQHAAISLKVERERVTLLVKDDGVGLRSRRDQARRRGDVLIPGGWVVLKGHYGLVGMQERAALLGGAFQVQSAPGEGTTLRVELPR